MPPEILYGVGALLLLIGLVWGVWRGRLKSPTAQAISEEAVREEYQEPERYDEARQEELAEKAKAAEAAAEARERNDSA